MRVPVDHKNLIDSPYDGENTSLFEFTTSDTEDFVQDVINGNPTCYLVSGYRGAGKSSFIKKLEKDIKAKDTTALFIYLNFAKYEDRSIVLRKLIRSFYLTAEEQGIFENLKENHTDDLAQFRELYERTFYEVSKNTNEKKEDKRTSTLGFKAALKDIAVMVAAIIAGVAVIFGLDAKNWYSWLLSITPLFAVWKFFSWEIKSTTETTDTNEISKSMLYDDEIAEHYLIEVLQAFQDDVSPIFVLDELDKIKDDELAENLINELKPIMLSGLCSFIVVAGQSLYYNYYSSQTKDDGVLSSLFSKVHHVSLFSASELRVLFYKLITTNMQELDEDAKRLLDAYADYLVFESKRIPRRFIVLIRQNVTWEENQAFLEFDNTLDELSVYSRILGRVEQIEDQEIAPEGYQAPIKDYFSMQLLIKAHNILKSQNLFFTDYEIFDYNGE
ncbi:MAG: ATP-binding protein [Cyclobacteriaceae bacterium]